VIQDCSGAEGEMGIGEGSEEDGAVLIPYASDIRKGRRQPHPRHWKALAKLKTKR